MRERHAGRSYECSMNDRGVDAACPQQARPQTPFKDRDAIGTHPNGPISQKRVRVRKKVGGEFRGANRSERIRPRSFRGIIRVAGDERDG